MLMMFNLRPSFCKRLVIFFIIFFCALNFTSQVSYNAAASYSLRKTVSTYTGNAIQVRRDCDNATTNIGFTACGDLDTTALRNFVLVPNPLSAITPSAQGAYSLRKLRCAYSGNAINIRRSCDNATRDIGFNSNGDLDTITLKTFVMASNPLSAIASSAAAAFSLRKLSCSYVGNAITVRRSSDNTTSNIGFTTNGDLDTTALKTFVGASNGFVTTWFDQSGNVRNATQATAANQPRIINAGVIERQNGVPALRFLGLSSGLATANFDVFDAAACFNGVAKVNTNLTYNAIVSKTGVPTNNNFPGPLDFYNNNLIVGNGTGATFFTTSQNFNAAQSLGAWTFQTQLAGNKTAFLNSTSILNSAAAATHVDVNRPLNIGARNDGVTGLDGWISEIVTFGTLPSSTDRAFLEWTQGQYYNISGIALGTIPAGAASAFVTTWYDQSGNNRHATQATAGLQPRIMNAGVIEKNSSNRPSIFFNGTYLKNAFFLTTQPLSTSCVWRARGLANPGGELFGWGDNAGGGRRYGAWFAFNSATQGRYGVENQGAGTVGSSLLNTNTWYISSQILPGTSLPALTQWINGTSQAMTNIGAPAAMNITAGEFAIGTIPTANTQGHNGDIQELIYFSTALSATDRQYIEYGQSAYYRISGPSVPPALPITPPSAYVSIWYDQSGNGINLSQTGATTRQPQIVNAGNIVRLNGSSTWPAMQGTNALQTNLTATFTTAYTGAPLTVNSVLRSDINSSSNLRVVSVGNAALNTQDWSNSSYFNINQRNTNQFVFERSGVNPATSFVVGAPLILSGRFDGSNRQLFNNGTGSATQGDGSSFNFNAIRLLQSINTCCETSEALTGKMSEFGMYYSALNTTRRTLLETNQSAFYGIAISNGKYTPPTSTSYIYYVNGVGRESATDSVAGTRSTSGMGVSVTTAATAFLKDNGDYLTYGMNCFATPFTSASNLPVTVLLRWTNDWYVNKTDIGSNNGLMTIFFDYSDYGAGAGPGVASNYVLLYRSSAAGTFSIVPSTTVSTAGDRVLFNVDGSNITTNYFYTIGTIDPAASPLPIELIDFNCNLINPNTIQLNWKTATELNSHYFSIERSTDAINYQTIGNVIAAGNSLSIKNYSFIDEHALKDISYYRLKSVDIDGTYEYSPICSVTNGGFDTFDNISIYPNPTNSLLTIDFKNNTTISTESYSLMDITGKKIEVPFSIIDNKIILDLSYLKSGLYFIEAKNIDGEKTVRKIVLQK